MKTPPDRSRVFACAGWLYLALVLSAAFGQTLAQYPPWDGGHSTDRNDPRWQVIEARDASDPGWRGKMAIEFYGQVVDEANQPAIGATITGIVVDLSPDGSTHYLAKSGPNGLFSFTHISGRGIRIEVKMDGYDASAQGRHSFEYADFDNSYFHLPDARQPIVFHLRKKLGAEPMFYREQDVKLNVGATVEVDLRGGVRLEVRLLSNSPERKDPWSMQVSVVGGGLQVHREEFPFLAPASGYEASLLLDKSTPKPPLWVTLYQGGSLFVKTDKVYGRVEVTMMPGKQGAHIESWINPSGSQNLEFDPMKRARP